MSTLAASAALWGAVAIAVATIVLLVPRVIAAWSVLDGWIDSDAWSWLEGWIENDGSTQVRASIENH
jgi:hypothetical protein